MWLRLGVACCVSLYIASSQDIFDVTTVYDLNGFPNGDNNLVPGRVHIRKNARGFLLRDQHNSRIVPSRSSDLTCDNGDDTTCSWNATASLSRRSEGCNDDYPWKCKHSDECLTWGLICGESESSCEDSTNEIGCDGRGRDDDIACSTYYTTRYVPATWRCDGQVDCWDGSDEEGCPALATFIQRGGELVSPVLSLSAKTSHQCLALAFRLDQNSSWPALELLARLPDQSTKHLTYVYGYNNGWNIRNFNISLQEYSEQAIRLVLVRTGNAPMEISRISPCSNNDEDVEIFTPARIASSDNPRRSASLSIYNIFTSTWAPPRLLTDPRRICVNGGVLTTAGCACPPGFTGPDCRVGCGSARFGQDCQSMCSQQLEECRGLLLCTNYTGCRCAPGYSGYSCNNTCSVGWYGNDCSQKCNCAPDSRCDIYTGECEACSPGYVPPYCQQEFVYCAAGPVLSSTEYNTISVVFDANDVLGLGTPILYQLQYRQKDEEWRTYTIKLLPDDKSNISETINGLNHGQLYEIRVLLMDSGFNKYDGVLVKTSEMVTKCDIPEYYNYDVQANSSISSVLFTWSNPNNSGHWCPVEYFEVSWKENWLWLNRTTTAGNFTLGNRLPGTPVAFKVRAKTTAGFAPYSTPFVATTMNDGVKSVERLRMVDSQPSSVELSWLPPSDHMGRTILYKINYKCVNRPACSLGCGDSPEGELSQTDTSLTLSSLLPFTQYRVTVTPEGGPRSSIFVGTKGVVPSEIPKPSSRPALQTNTSLTVFWEPVPVCSSFLVGYNYQLFKASESMKVLASGFTRDTDASFYNLTVSSEYAVKVFIVNAAGANPQAYLSIDTSTSATAPEAVRNLTVYKRSRSMVGLRWAEPRATYGALQSFTVSVEGPADGEGEHKETAVLRPEEHCAAWPHLYCHTVDGLGPNKKYNFTVSARNTEVPRDGFPATIVGVTKESYPTAPENLQIVNVSSNNVIIKWQHPNLANGVLRSFLVNIEETESFIQESCCQDYPIVEVRVNNEVKEYEAELTGLRPASTYFVGVTAKTVGLGPSQSLTVTTRPPALPLTVTPPTSVNGKYWGQEGTGSNSTEHLSVYYPLVKAHLVLFVYNVSLNDSGEATGTKNTGIKNEKVNRLLKQIIPTPFAFYTEYNQDGEVPHSEWGDSSASRLQAASVPVLCRPAAVQVTEYNGVYNADLGYARDGSAICLY